ncbi:MAG: hypothetical protein IJ157_14200 [Clostridia bacterium]|nr:hypothetical protein [Clostridia bacterium]
MNLLREMAEHIEFCGFGRMDRDIFWGRMPDSPDACVCLFSSDSALPGEESGARLRLVNRAASPGEAYERACGLAAALDGFDGFLAGDGRMARIDVTAAASGMGADGKKRELYRTELRVRYCGE